MNTLIRRNRLTRQLRQIARLTGGLVASLACNLMRRLDGRRWYYWNALAFSWLVWAERA